MNPAAIALAARTSRIEPFHTMELMKHAAELEAAGRSVIHMSIGEPDFTAPPQVLAALAAAMANGRAQYTMAVGTPSLREAISKHYLEQFGAKVDPARIIITAGASGALLLTMASLISAGDEILMPDPSYPCNRHFVAAFDGLARLIPVGAAERYQLTEQLVAEHWNSNTRGVLVASPSNPTGTSVPQAELKKIVAYCKSQGGVAVIDEIYQGLYYDGEPQSVLQFAEAADPVIVINSFSKYFNMTGWRLGWAVIPAELVPVFERLQQNLFICASALAQHAALACFLPETLLIYEERREQFRKRRDFIVPALREIGLEVPVTPDGAYYVYADISRFYADSGEFVRDILEHTGVSLVPGLDFGHADPKRWVRLSYATPLPNLQEAVARIRAFLHRPASIAA